MVGGLQGKIVALRRPERSLHPKGGETAGPEEGRIEEEGVWGRWDGGAQQGVVLRSQLPPSEMPVLAPTTITTCQGEGSGAPPSPLRGGIGCGGGGGQGAGGDEGYPPCPGTSSVCRVTSGWFLDSVFKPKIAIEPWVDSGARPSAAPQNKFSGVLHRGMCALAFLTVKHMDK